METILHNQTVRNDSILHINNTCVVTDSLRAAKTGEALINTALALFGTPLNAIVLITQLLANRVQGYSTPIIYMTNLYSANFITLLVLPFIVLSNQHLLPANAGLCKFLSLLYYSSCSVGFATVALIAADRYRVIHRRTQARQSYRNTYLIVLLTWAIGLICATPGGVYTTIVAHADGQNDIEHNTCIMHFIYEEMYVLMFWKILIVLAWGVVPVIMMVWFYAFFYSTVQRTAQKQQRTLQFVKVLLLSFIIIQTPYVSIMIFNAYATVGWSLECNDLTKRRVISTFSRIVPNLHCVVNPILYALLGNDFTTKVRQCFRGELMSRRSFLRSRQQAQNSDEPQTAVTHTTAAAALTETPKCKPNVKRGMSFGARPSPEVAAAKKAKTKRLSQSYNNLRMP
ncbi:envelope glycoprotein UL33 [Cercopithecine betaherpesvirus 5]|uniref:Envelope glycoprotein UL33 n=1 Tax=Simian cytomegalovirus (strain Colburn) TaxID=50292 RepID=G8XTA5_SCMVC|nr:envelope glycoprotein UL33 [Cercopithecine betaherpesvirus 5]AEV80398.1 envelope glycoprotein UL33 [Cercopithecine betaherpesvirus 5]